MLSCCQANLLLQDHAQKFHLSNGLVVDLKVLGVASIDMSGSISISLWYKTSNSLIKNRYSTTQVVIHMSPCMGET